jgi:hypothetical protein
MKTQEETAQLKVGDVISQVHGEKEVLRVALTKVREEMLEGYILLSDYETWGYENIGETFRMTPDYYCSVWSNNRSICYWRVL